MSEAIGILPSGGFVVLDTTLDADLVAEGLVRDVVRVVQQARKEAGLDVSDRIDVTLWAPDPVWDAASARREYLAGETLAVSVSRGADGSGATTGTVGDAIKVSTTVTRA